MARYVLEFPEIDQSLVAVVGGKGAHLGELSRIDGIRVPGGFCVTVDAFSRILAEDRSIDGPIDPLSSLTLDDQDDIRERSALIRRKIEAVVIPDDMNSAIRGQLRKLGEHTSYAVRSSATAEDMPTASFAGQHDTYLNVVGSDEILRAISRCWASLFTERAVTYRLRNMFDHRKVRMAVVVQQMVAPEVSGILFTADPLTGNRKISSVEAIYGLGEALVSGLVNADVHTVRDGEVVARSIATKQRFSRPSSAGGTLQEAVEPERQGRPALSDEEVVRIAELGRKIERHFGRPQDIEWCLVGGNFQIVQSRPITTLFPVPKTNDSENHVFISVGHQQMMTDPMRPLGLSLFQMTAGRRMHEAGGRLFVDVSQMLASPTRRAGFLELMGKSDLLIRDALQKIVDRGDFIPSVPDDGSGQPPAGPPAEPIETDSAIVSALIERNQASIASVKSAIEPKAGLELLDFIEADILELKRILFDPRGHQVFMAAIEATWWLNEHLEAWLGEKNVADTLTLSVPNNITSDMGLALMDVADAIRPYSDVVTYLQHVEDENYLNLMSGFEGGQEARAAIMDFLHTYGMRCVGEIDITRPRWNERPTAILPMILVNIRNFGPGESKRRFSQGRREAERKEEEVLQRLFNLPDGKAKAAETKRMIDRVRTFIGFREYPKYGMISRYAVYKQALMREAERLVLADVIRESDDIFYLSLEELREAVRTGVVDNLLIAMRKEEFRSYEALTPPRVLTSDGEIVTGSYRRETLPADVLVGLPVSAGRVEGRARVILDIEGADLEPGDILVTTFTDPSWTPLFVAIKGLVTEVGGMMTHGAVIAREYGVPAVVGVEHATRLIRDGQRIRVHGTDGYVEFLDE